MLGGIGADLETLATLLSSSDGLVPLSSQIPAGGTWTSGTPLACAHHKQPSDLSAISQILAQLTVLNPAAGPRAVLLIGPAFADRTAWSTFLGQAESERPGSTKPGAHFDLRIPNADPLNIDLNPVSTIADYYTADLQDSGVGNLVVLTGQIGRIVDRIRQLRPGLKVTLVAHSTAGVAARAYTAANAAKVQDSSRSARHTPARRSRCCATDHWPMRYGCSIVSRCRSPPGRSRTPSNT